MPFGPITNPFLSGVLGMRAANEQSSASELRGVLGMLQQQQMLQQQEQERQTLPLKLEALKRAGVLQEAQIAELQRKGGTAAQQQQATGVLANLLAGGGYQGTVNGPSGVAMNDADALQRVQQAEASGQQLGVNVPSPTNVQALSVLADPNKAIPEVLKQMRPAAAITPYQAARLDQGERQMTAAAGREPLVPVKNADGTVTYATRSDAVGKPVGSAAAGATAGQLSPDALGPMAWEKLLFGTNPPGMGNASAAQRQQVNDERARLGKGLGLSDMEMAMLPQDNKVKMKAVDTLTKWGATVGRSAEKLDLDLGVALDYAKKLPLGQVQVINKGILAGMKEFNSPDANAYASAINSVRQEYARLMSGPTSNAMLPVEAMKKGNELLSTGVDVASLEEVGKQMRRDAGNTMTATQNGIQALRGSITSLGREPAFRDQGKTPEFASEADAAKAMLKPGTRVIINGRPGTWQ